MEGLNAYIIPYTISQIVSIIILFVAWKHTKAARITFALIFLLASGVNMYTGIATPDAYLVYGEMAIPLYKDFIYGWFSSNVTSLIAIIATGQFLIAIGMLLKGWLVKMACIGIIISTDKIYCIIKFFQIFKKCLAEITGYTTQNNQTNQIQSIFRQKTW